MAGAGFVRGGSQNGVPVVRVLLYNVFSSEHDHDFVADCFDTMIPLFQFSFEHVFLVIISCCAMPLCSHEKATLLVSKLTTVVDMKVAARLRRAVEGLTAEGERR